MNQNLQDDQIIHGELKFKTTKSNKEKHQSTQFKFLLKWKMEVHKDLYYYFMAYIIVYIKLR